MFISTASSVLLWYITLLFLGIICFPLASRVFSALFDKGYLFSKTLALILLSYSMYLFGTLHILPFTQSSLFVLIAVLFGINTLVFRKWTLQIDKNERRRLGLLFLFEEFLFLGIYLLWVYIRSFAPDIHGLEKYMDFGFINSLLRGEYFPPKDMWFTPLSINYYYFGHLATAVLTKLTGIPSAITFNTMLATIVALCFTSTFSLISTLLSKLSFKSLFPFLAGALLTASMLTFGGNLHPIYSFFATYNTDKPEPFWDMTLSFTNPCYKQPTTPCAYPSDQHYLFPNNYWYPNATRFIHHTIHEFPIYSWVVSDLHGHVLDIPFVFLFLAFSMQTFFQTIAPSSKQKLFKLFSLSLPSYVLHFVLWGFFIAIMYMTNAWDGIIYLLFTVLFLTILHTYKKGLSLVELFPKKLLSLIQYLFPRIVVILLSFILFSLPFSLFLKPPVSGIGVLCAPKMLTTMRNIGPFLFEADHCQKSPIWQLGILYGSFLFFGISFFFLIRKHKKLLPTDVLVSFFFMFSLLLVIIPEFIYLKDIYPDHYRANTMFKLVFQAFMLLSLASGYAITRILSLSPRNFWAICKKAGFTFITMCILLMCFLYTYFSVISFYGDVTNPTLQKSLDGTAYLRSLYPDDYAALVYLQTHIKGQPVVLEAQGDSYTDFARVSTNTGLPTVLGWTVHEWLWRGTYDVPAPRIEEIKSLYESTDTLLTKQLLEKYHIQYVFIGSLERQKYTNLFEDKFPILGQRIFTSGDTHVYKIN